MNRCLPIAVVFLAACACLAFADEQKAVTPVEARKKADERTNEVRLDKALLDRCTALAKKKRLSQDALIACGLRVLLAVEEEA